MKQSFRERIAHARPASILAASISFNCCRDGTLAGAHVEHPDWGFRGEAASGTMPAKLSWLGPRSGAPLIEESHRPRGRGSTPRMTSVSWRPSIGKMQESIHRLGAAHLQRQPVEPIIGTLDAHIEILVTIEVNELLGEPHACPERLAWNSMVTREAEIILLSIVML